ncbi:hypothetical protein BV22DRAFT_625754 [Leucogyrophana mollusca]|uniref:Uncharacterized protein n=1 Tax=Leucogyrophana mollusca TaxID=85980 RepID=A0ACB8BDH9_9AGAM|nr:hypothetical protein BV22DRAFT_625754 [Leucogyrophana mollusca]
MIGSSPFNPATVLRTNFGFRHEHLYEQMSERIIRSDSFPADAVATDRLLLGAKVVLCTLSMLSNRQIDFFIRLVPVETLIFDEASQIEVGDYIPVLHRFQQTLRKLVLIGDDKQLAPYGQDDVTELQSIFELPRLRNRALFLDTQYRMPVVVGEFISRQVYKGKLRTDHRISDPRACRFVDVQKGKEEKMGHSWVNHQEVTVVVHIARLYHAEGKSYRIVTPYDAQRSLIEKELQSAKLPWEDKCFNVDSFQGNEEDYIILSIVRSNKVGFLRNTRRTNVMLTRCKRSMIICTSRSFVTNVAASTLIGRMVVAMGQEAWMDRRDLVRGRLL